MATKYRGGLVLITFIGYLFLPATNPLERFYGAFGAFQSFGFCATDSLQSLVHGPLDRTATFDILDLTRGSRAISRASQCSSERPSRIAISRATPLPYSRRPPSEGLRLPKSRTFVYEYLIHDLPSPMPLRGCSRDLVSIGRATNDSRERTVKTRHREFVKKLRTEKTWFGVKFTQVHVQGTIPEIEASAQ
jgi:hypothetical protein